MALHAEPEKPSLRSRLHIKPSTSLKVSRVAIFVLLTLISAQTVGSALLWYAGKIKAESGIRVVTTSSATSVTSTGAALHGTYDYPGSVTQRGFEYGLTTSYGSQAIDSSDPSTYQYVASKSYGTYGNGAGQFDDIRGLAQDSSGYVYVADTNNSRVQKYDRDGNFLTSWGTLGVGDGQMDHPKDIAVDSDNNVYVADWFNRRIEKFTSDGVFVTKWGSYGPGDGQFANAWALAVGPDDSVYVMDIGADWDPGGGIERVQKFTSDGVFVTKWGSYGSGDGQFMNPTGGGIDKDNNVYIADGSHRVQKFSLDGLLIEKWGNDSNMSGRSIVVSNDGLVIMGGDSSVTTYTPTLNATLSNLQCDSTYHYRAFITDSDSTDNGADSTFTTEPCTSLRNLTTLPADNLSRTGATLHGATDYPQGITQRGFQYGTTTGYGSIVTDDSDTERSYIKYFDGGIGPPSTNNRSEDIDADSEGNVYIAVSGRQFIRKYSPSGVFILEWSAASRAIAVGPDNSVYVLSDDGVSKYTSSGSLVLSWGSRGISESAGFFWDSNGIDVGPDGSVYIADTGNHRIQKFDADGNFILKWGENGVGDGQFGFPDDVVVDSQGGVYVSDHNPTYPTPTNRIQKFDADGNFILKWGETGVGQGQFGTLEDGGLGIDPRDDSVLVVTNFSGGGVQRFSNTGQYIDSPSPYGAYLTGITVSKGGGLYTVTGLANTRSSYYAFAIDTPIVGLSCGTEYHYRPYVTDRGATQYGSDATFTTDACPPMFITTSNLRDGTLGVSYQDYISVQDDTGTVAYSVSSGDLPPGLSVDPATGFITGVPTQLGTFNFDVTANDGHSSDSASLSITINDVAPISITTQSLPDAQLNGGSYFGYQENIYTQDSVSDVTFSITAGALPNGLTLSQNGSVGTIEGTPSDSAGTYTFTVQAQDSRGTGDGGTDSKEYSINLPETSHIHITANALPPGRVGSSYDASIGYEFANAQPVFSVVSGSLPPGVSLTLQGYLQGVPTQVGTYGFMVKADDGLSSDSKSLSLVVLPAFAGYDNAPIVKITSPGDNVLFPGGASTILGTGPANQTISLFVDGALAGTTVCTPEGQWQYQATGIARGNHTLEAKWIPGAEIAFVPIVDSSEMRTIIKIYDTSNDVLISQIALPEFSYGVNTTASRAGVLVNGLDMATGTAKIWSINLNTGGVDTIPTDDIIYATSFSPDSKYIYSLGASGGFVKTDFSNLNNQQTQLWPSNQNHVATMHVSDDGSTIYAATTDIAFGPLNPADVTSSSRLGIGKIYVIDAATASVIRTIDVVNNADANELEYATGLAVTGDIAYIPVVHRSATDTPGTTAESYIKLYNVKTGVYISQIPVSALSASSTSVPLGGYADSGSDAVYFRGAPITDGNMNSIIKLNVQNDDVSTIELTASESASNMWAWGMGVGGNGTKLYSLRNVISGGTPQSLMEVLSLTTGSLLNSSGYPINTGGSFSASIQLGQGFIAKIAPPTDAIHFSVNTPTCAELNTCSPSPPPPPSNCANTNTCPVAPPPAVNPPVPTTVGTTSPKSPKIVVTPFPPASPATSRLGWFDRGILAVAHFVPRQAAIGFPYLLFLLLLIFALSLYYQSSNEVRKDKLNREFVAKRKAIRAQQDNFIALASHYLNTPITIIQNGIEVMGERGGGPKPK